MTMQLLAMLLVLAVAPLAADDWFPRHNFTFAAGASRPRGDLGSILTDSPGIEVGYGYRFMRYFQADAGLNATFGAASVKDFLQTGLGDFRIRDREYFPLFGGRAIIPFGRAMLSAGGGGVYLHYKEVVRQPSQNFRIDCPVCTSRNGFGYYAMANASMFVDRGKHFRVGINSRFIRGNTDGEAIGGVPSVRTKDHWIGIYGEFGFSF